MKQAPLNYGTLTPRHRLTRRQVRSIFGLLAAAPVLLLVLFDVGCGLEHKSILWPWIDTRTAAGYSESSFQKVWVGMTRQQVEGLMCKPLYVDTLSPDGRGYVPVPPAAKVDVGFLRYSYTGDGRCPWGDFAWFGRAVEFQGGIVTQVVSHVYED